MHAWGYFHFFPLDFELSIKKNHPNDKLNKQAGAELGQAQLKLGLGFTSTIDSK